MPRILRSHFSYLLTAAVVLAVTVGGNVLLFTVVSALWIRPLPFPEPDRVVTFSGVPFATENLAHARFQLFEGGVAGQLVRNDAYPWLRLPRIELAEPGDPLETFVVTPDYFRVLRVSIRGRDFAPTDDLDNAEPVAIISDDVWSRRFGRRTELIGAVLPAKPLPVRIIGVAPPGFGGSRRGDRADIWIPVSVGRRVDPTGRSQFMMVFGRLGPGQTAAIVTERFDALAPNVLRSFNARLVPVSEVFGTSDSAGIVIRERNPLLLASVLTTLLLLGGCVTIAALVLMHYERRRGELALKISLGAGRRRLVMQLAGELSVLAAFGFVGGLMLVWFGTRFVSLVSLPGGVEIGRLNPSIDWRACLVAAAATAATLTTAAAVPLARSTGPRLAGELLSGLSGTAFGSHRVRQKLLAVQVCATTIVLVVAALFVRTVGRSFGGAAGFDIDHTVFISVAEPSTGRPVGDPLRLTAWYEARNARVMAVLGGLPGVLGVADGMPPIGADAARTRRSSKTVKVGDRESQLLMGTLTGSAELLPVLGVRLLTGRQLTDADRGAVPLPTIVTESFAQELWPGEAALGQIFKVVQIPGGPNQVVGICEDFAFGSLAQPGKGVIVTSGVNQLDEAQFVIRTEHPHVMPELVREAFPSSVTRVVTGKEVIRRDVGRQRLGAWVFSGFGAAALLLAVGGAFGLVAYIAESRRREFGVRVALGANHGDLVRQGLMIALAPVSIGVAAGLVVGSLVSKTFETHLVGIAALDGLTYTVVGLALLSSATVAGLAAAWRLRRTMPTDALRTT